MIENELLFLGLLMKRPMHGYDIKRQIHEELEPVTGLKIKSIYYPLRKLEEAGLIKQKWAKEGNRPEKIDYYITAKGKKRFDDLITKSLMSVERPFFHINLSLYFLIYVEKQEAIKRLRMRVLRLRKVCRHLESSFTALRNQSAHVTSIVQHDLDLCRSELDSISRLILRLSD